MPGPKVIPVIGDEQLPDRVDTVVIGGGIIGVSTALELAEKGQRVALCEKGGIAQEQSSRNWGWVRISRRDKREIPLMAEALRIWPKLKERTGRDLGYTQAGIAFACETDAEIAQFENWSEHLKPFQLECGFRSGQDLADMLPSASVRPKAVFYTPTDGRAEPQKAAPAIAEAARDRGAAILTQCAVRGVESAGGQVSGVVTERGRIACDAVVLAGGAWSRLFSGNLGIELPQLKVLNTVLRTAPIEGGPETSYWEEGLGLRKRQDGGYTLANGTLHHADIVPDSFRLARAFLPAFRKNWRALKPRVGTRFLEEARYARRWSMEDVTPFEQTRVLDPKPSDALVRQIQATAAKRFSVFKDAKIEQTWAGMIDVTPDAVPVISVVDTLPGFFIATGFSGHGFGIGPAAGRLMAELVMGVTPCVDPTPYRLSRFADGTPMIVDAGF
ncbi:FAD-binding oxidoreductase [Epibacterium ulvae]|uniref:NAD(P)/FAD-dependent oxidoreductase n=1 Tax=Epibacterium ulvae TaxID=1156985 RepID=UPI001BFC030F|nr:FAD-binding oxidoreductase [Epibacterium ulvae]MBT8153438.1 FAD-binding oxidoreductase [Epibacterium ulvae]